MELKRVALVLLGGVAITAAACNTASPPIAAPTTQVLPQLNPEIANGGTVTMAVPYLPTNFNPSTPAGSNRVTQMAMEQVWPQAFVVDPDYQAQTTGFVESAEVVGLKPMTVVYVIDPKATWSDGYPITATDFVFNWQQQLRIAPMLPSAGYLAGYRDITSITGSDGGKTVTVVFSTPYADWEGLFANLIPAHIAGRNGWVSAFAGFHRSDLISGGPFIVSSFEPGKRLVLTRNTRYWGTPAYVHSIVFLVEGSVRASLEGLRRGKVSIAEVPPGPGLDRAMAIAEDTGSDLTVATSPSPVLWQLVFNVTDPLVGNLTLRRALALITDPDQLVADSVNLDDPLTLAADSRVFAEGEPGSASEPVSAVYYDPVEAAALFSAVGYVPDADGRLRAGGVGKRLRLTLTGPSGNPVIDALELQLQAEWASSGVDLTIHNVPFKGLLRTALPQGRYQVALAPYVIAAFPSWNAVDYTDPVLPDSAVSPSKPPTTSDGSIGSHQGVSSARGSTVMVGGDFPWSVTTEVGTEPGAAATGAVTRDITGIDDPQVGAGFEQVMSELNANTQDQLLSTVDATLTRDLPTLPLFQVPVSLVQQADIVNVSDSPGLAGPLWNAENWAIELPVPTS